MEMISVFYVCTLIYKRLAIHSTQPIVLQLINLQCYVLWQIILLSVIPPNTSHITSFPSSRQTPSSSGMHGTEPESLWPGKPVSHLALKWVLLNMPDFHLLEGEGFKFNSSSYKEPEKGDQQRSYMCPLWLIRNHFWIICNSLTTHADRPIKTDFLIWK